MSMGSSGGGDALRTLVDSLPSSTALAGYAKQVQQDRKSSRAVTLSVVFSPDAEDLVTGSKSGLTTVTKWQPCMQTTEEPER
jgi:hypothetical protein